MHRKLIAALALATLFIGGTAMAQATGGSPGHYRSHDHGHGTSHFHQHSSHHPREHGYSYGHGHGHGHSGHNHHVGPRWG